MRLYLDDDSVSALLVRLLAQAGHDVQQPADVGMSGLDDPIHLTHAVRQDRVLLSHNYRDFENLHDLIKAVGGRHPGIFVVRKDNNPRRDLHERGIVRAIAKLIAAGVPIADQYTILNHWR
jgi:hypothetical protein